MIHPDKCEHKDATKASAAVNQAITTLESPIARSELHTMLAAKLEKHAKEFGKKKRKGAVSAALQNRVKRTIDKKPAAKKPASKPSSDSKATSASQKPTTSKPPCEPSEPAATEAASSAPHKTEEAGKPSTGDKANLKFWEVSGLQVRPYKGWITVRVESDAVRKFQYKEWQDEEVAKLVAAEFAKQASKTCRIYRSFKTKSDKVNYMKELGITAMTGKESVYDMQMLLNQAGWLGKNGKT